MAYRVSAQTTGATSGMLGTDNEPDDMALMVLLFMERDALARREGWMRGKRGRLYVTVGESEHPELKVGEVREFLGVLGGEYGCAFDVVSVHVGLGSSKRYPYRETLRMDSESAVEAAHARRLLMNTPDVLVREWVERMKLVTEYWMIKPPRELLGAVNLGLDIGFLHANVDVKCYGGFNLRTLGLSVDDLVSKVLTRFKSFRYYDANSVLGPNRFSYVTVHGPSNVVLAPGASDTAGKMVTLPPTQLQTALLDKIKEWNASLLSDAYKDIVSASRLDKIHLQNIIDTVEARPYSHMTLGDTALFYGGPPPPIAVKLVNIHGAIFFWERDPSSTVFVFNEALLSSSATPADDAQAMAILVERREKLVKTLHQAFGTRLAFS